MSDPNIHQSLFSAGHRYEGWPHKLTPTQYGHMLICRESSLAERELLLDKVPENWRYPVIYAAAHSVAHDIADRITTRDERRALLAALPHAIRVVAEPLAASVYRARVLGKA